MAGFDRDRVFADLNHLSHVAVATSGGSDSLALLFLLDDWRRTHTGRPAITALTVDHGLREGSAGEALRVKGWALRRGIPHRTLRWDGAKPSSGIQAKARAARYNLMTAWCRMAGASHLLTAHTRDDQAETVLMRLRRTVSIDSIAGILPETAWNGIILRRPLLAAGRAELRAFLRSLGQEWIEDPSNADPRFERVRIRQMMPELAARGIGADRLAVLAAEARAAADALAAAAAGWLRMQAREYPEGYAEVPLQSLVALEPEVRVRAIGGLVRRYGSGKGAAPAELADVAAWLSSGGPPRRTLGGAMLARRHSALIVGREAGRIAASPVPVPEQGRLIWDGRFMIDGPAGWTIVPAGALPGLPRRPDLPAFVQAGLPAAKSAAGGIAVPHLGIGSGVAANFLPAYRS